MEKNRTSLFLMLKW